MHNVVVICFIHVDNEVVLALEVPTLTSYKCMFSCSSLSLCAIQMEPSGHKLVEPTMLKR